MALDIEWVTLYAALVWIRTRDSKLVSLAIIRRGWSLDEVDGWDPKPRADEELDAWRKLCAGVNSKKVRARGYPFNVQSVGSERTLGNVQKTRIDFSVAIQEPEEEEEDEYLAPLPQPLEKGVQALELGERDELLPLGWALNGGTGWKNVEISKTDLSVAFPAGFSAPSSTAPRASQAINRRFYGETTEAIVRELARAGFPPALTQKTLIDLVNQKLRARIDDMVAAGEFGEIEATKIKRTVHRSTINRALEKIKREPK
jgi:hypothetical protein